MILALRNVLERLVRVTDSKAERQLGFMSLEVGQFLRHIAISTSLEKIVEFVCKTYPSSLRVMFVIKLQRVVIVSLIYFDTFTIEEHTLSPLSFSLFPKLENSSNVREHIQSAESEKGDE